MTNATKTLAILFAGSLVLALATSFGWSSSSTAAFQEQLLAVDTSAVQAVRIERAGGESLRLERAEGSWSVVPSDTSATYPASTQSVTDLLTQLPSLKVSAVTTRRPDKHPLYGVDSTGTTVTMLGADDEPLGQLILGRTEMRRSQSKQSGNRVQNMMQRMRGQRGNPVTYVRRPDAQDVYSINRSLSSITNRGVEGWRDKQIWSISEPRILRVDFRFPGDSSFTMRRAASTDTADAGPDTWLSEGDTLETTEVSSALRTLSSPTADGFVEGASPDNFGEGRYAVTLYTAEEKRRTLRLRPGDGQKYVAAADGFPYVAELAKRRWDRSVLAGRTAFLKNE
jgi:hypothetical protein